MLKQKPAWLERGEAKSNIPHHARREPMLVLAAYKTTPTPSIAYASAGLAGWLSEWMVMDRFISSNHQMERHAS